jgi:hypothetical protein
MISEPHPDVRRLLERMIVRAGDEPAQLARAASPSLQIVCASVAVPSRELAEIVDFAGALVKPYTAEQLMAIIDQALPESASAAAASATDTVDTGASAPAKNASTQPHASRAASGR